VITEDELEEGTDGAGGAAATPAAIEAKHAAVAQQMGEGGLRIIRTATWRLDPRPPLPPAAPGAADAAGAAALRAEAAALLRDAGLPLDDDAAAAGFEGVRTPDEAEVAMQRLVRAGTAGAAAAAAAVAAAAGGWLLICGREARAARKGGCRSAAGERSAALRGRAQRPGAAAAPTGSETEEVARL
jgi:hypothetical protein